MWLFFLSDFLWNFPIDCWWVRNRIWWWKRYTQRSICPPHQSWRDNSSALRAVIPFDCRYTDGSRIGFSRGISKGHPVHENPQRCHTVSWCEVRERRSCYQPPLPRLGNRHIIFLICLLLASVVDLNISSMTPSWSDQYRQKSTGVETPFCE